MHHRRPEDIVAVVNAAVVLLLPFLIVALTTLFGSGMTTTVRPQRWFFDNALRTVMGLVPVVTAVAPGALVAGWRSWVHAHRALERRRYGWRGVAEAGAFGFIACFLVVGSGVFMRAAAGPPQDVPFWLYFGYPAFYATLAMAVGLAVGVVLQMTGMLTLRACVGSLTALH